MIRQGTLADATEIARIINQAFEIEREFRAGDRTSPDDVRRLIERDSFRRPKSAAETRAAPS